MAETIGNEELIVGLYDREALQFSDFKWKLKSGRQSPLYYNQRKLLSYDAKSEMDFDSQLHLRELAIDGYNSALDEINNESYTHLYGIPQAMTAMGALVALKRGKSYLWGRVGVEKSYGAHAAIEGDFEEHSSVVALDDVITDAASKLETAESLQNEKLVPAVFVTMFDREEGGAKKVEEAGYGFVAVFGLEAAMIVLSAERRIGAQEFEWVAKYHDQLEADGVI